MAEAREMSRGQAGRADEALGAGWRESERASERHTDTRSGPPAQAHLGLALLQQRLQALLGRAALVVVAHQQDDVVPAVHAHHLEPHARLVRVGRHGAQEAQVDALRAGRGRPWTTGWPGPAHPNKAPPTRCMAPPSNALAPLT